MLRQASAGMLWSKQLFYYDVSRWLDGDPTQPQPPEVRKTGRNSKWRNFDGFDIISMPDKWEYPWFAAWDLAVFSLLLFSGSVTSGEKSYGPIGVVLVLLYYLIGPASASSSAPLSAERGTKATSRPAPHAQTAKPTQRP